MSGLLENMFMLGLGTIAMGKAEAERAIKDVLARNNVSETEGESIFKAAIAEGEKTKANLEAAVMNILKTRGASIMPNAKKIEELEARIAELERKLAEQSSGENGL